MQLSCILIDDEPLARQKLSGFLEKIQGVELAESFSNCMDAVPTITNNTVDLVFLDIQMDHMTGIDLLESVEVKPYVVIISAYEQFALKGYELNVCDYILKPYGMDRLIKTVEKVRKLKEKEQHTNEIDAEYIFVKSDYRIVKLKLDNIFFIEGMRDYICFHTSDGKILGSITFTQLVALLPESSFMRVHKSFIVCLSAIETIQKHRIFIGEHIIPISKSYRQTFYDKLKVHGINMKGNN